MSSFLSRKVGNFCFVFLFWEGDCSVLFWGVVVVDVRLLCRKERKILELGKNTEKSNVQRKEKVRNLCIPSGVRICKGLVSRKQY